MARKEKGREDPWKRRMTATERRTFLEKNLTAESDEARKRLEEHAFESFRDVVKDLRDRAFEIREGERVFGKTRFTDIVARRMEGWATKIELHLERRLWEFEEERKRLAKGLTAKVLRRQRREEERKEKLKFAVEAAERQAILADARMITDGVAPQCPTMMAHALGHSVRCSRLFGHIGPHRLP